MSGKHKKRNAIDQQFNARTIEMMESPPYRVLSLAARRVLDRICIELARHGGNDNGSLPVTYEQFVEYGIHRHAIAPATRELVALGFIEVTRQGKPSAGDYRWPILFRLIWVNCKSSRYRLKRTNGARSGMWDSKGTRRRRSRGRGTAETSYHKSRRETDGWRKGSLKSFSQCAFHHYFLYLRP